VTVVVDLVCETDAPTLVLDPDLLHQVQLAWAGASRRELRPVCNCGWRGIGRRPDVLGALSSMLADYERHL
jgi:hypothetical protein